MAEVIIMPKLGFNMDEGELVNGTEKKAKASKRVKSFLKSIQIKQRCR